MSPAPYSLLEVFGEELGWIRKSREARLDKPPTTPTDKNLIGLSFSGGGIRSATFNLGVLQGLAESRLLHKIDYISTVSGGGYIGSWLLGWMQHQNIGSKRVESHLNTRPLSADLNAEPAEIRFLRNYSNYLTPRTGILGDDFWTLIAVYLRNLFLNLFSLSLLFLALTLVPRAIIWLVHGLEVVEVWSAPHFAEPIRAQWIAATLGILCGFIATISIGWNITWLEPPREIGKDKQVKDKFGAKPSGVLLLIVIPLFLSAVLLSFAAIFIYAYYPLGWEDSFFAPLLEQIIPAVDWILLHLHTAWHPWMLGPLLGCGILLSQWCVACLFRWGILVLNIIRKKVLPTDGPTPIQIIGHSVLAGILAGSLFIPFTLLLSLDQVAPGAPGNKWTVLTYAPPAMIGIMLVAGTFHIGLLGRAMHDSHREWWARVGAVLFRYSVAWLVLFWIAIDFPPFLANFLASHPKWTMGSVLTWIISTTYGVLFGKSEKTSRWIPDLPFKQKIPGYLARLTPYIFILGLLLGFSLLGACLDSLLLGQGWGFGHRPDDHSFRPWTTLLLLASFGSAAYLSWRVDVNEFSIHNLYRNRLVRCYLGATVPNRIYQPWTGFSRQDDFRLDAIHSTCALQADPGTSINDGRPFPIFNTCLNVVRGKELALQMRRARSFIVTPLFSGFTWPGAESITVDSVYECTKLVGPEEKEKFSTSTVARFSAKISPEQVPNDAPKGGLSIGTAMAISGAAASPNMGHYSEPGIGFLMTVFDVRLGWWIGNPMHREKWIQGSPKFGLGWMISELLGLTTDQSDFVYLSDGGHFENLGLYELVRRRCRLIVTSDAGQDPTYAGADLRQAIEKCRVDFGINIEIDLSEFLPRQNPPHPAQHFVVGKIHYPPSDVHAHSGPHEGVLIVLKPNIVPGDPVDVAGYCKTNPHFPHDATANQWYDEAHFENYRALGQTTVRAASTAIEGVITGILV